MKAEDLFRALGDVDPKYVEELLLEKNGAAEQKPETAGETTVVPLKPRRRRKVWLSAAAAVVALVSGVSLLSRPFVGNLADRVDKRRLTVWECRAGGRTQELYPVAAGREKR